MSPDDPSFVCPTCGKRVIQEAYRGSSDWWLSHAQRCGIIGEWGGDAIDNMHCPCGFQLYKLSFKAICDHYNSHTVDDWKKYRTRNVLESM